MSTPRPHGHPPDFDEAATLPPTPQEGAAANPSASPPADPPVGTERVSVPGYEILGVLGRGGMGVVYKARQLSLGRVVALKMILHAEHAGGQELARFLAEAEAVAQLHHPNVVQLYEAGQHNGLPYFTLELVTGGSLADRLRAHPLPPMEAARLVRQIALGVEHAHGRGIVHRDLKPANILLDEDGTPRVTDFGLARRVTAGGGLTATGAVLGTPSYMAPEQAAGRKDIGPSVDVYALGAVLYECLTGKPPFQAATPLDTLVQVLADDPTPPRQVEPSIPVDLEAVCLKCLEKDPRRRYPTAAALAEDLARFLAGEPVTARQSGLMERLAGALDRVQLQASFAAYGTLLLWLAPVQFLPELWVTAVVLQDWPGYWLMLAQFGRVAAFLLVVGYHRGGHWLPRGAAERQLWAIWGSYPVICFVHGLSVRLATGLLVTAVELKIYQGWAALTALAFFCLAVNFWGYCAVIGVAFLVLEFVMAADLRWAPLEFGALWAVVLVMLGARLRRLGQQITAEAG